jgi:uncharacterized surface protein with fasciclin (FAS1) repeats
MKNLRHVMLTGAATAIVLLALPAISSAHCGSCGVGDKHDHDKAGAEEVTSTPSIVEIAAGNEDFSTLVAAVKAAGLVETLSGDGPFTVFAPTNAAFAKLPKGTVEDLLKPENKDQLIAVLTYHVVPGAVMAGDVVKLTEAKTVQGSKVNITVGKDQGVKVNNANVVATDIKASNGVIHVIDTVILPPKGKASK